jgi:uncharacterized protein YecT (DUF1311 family)
MRFRFVFSVLNAVGLAAFGAGLFGAAPAAAIDCAKAGNNVEKRICANPGLKTADAAMGQAYTALLKRAPDAEIHTMLVKSQRRWIAARDKGLDTDINGNRIAVSELKGVIASRTRRLNDTSKYGLIAVALEQRRYFGQFAAAEFAGFNTYCDFIPSDRDGKDLSYQCFGGVHVQKGALICDVSFDWATFALYSHYGVSRLANGSAKPEAYCDGQSVHGCDVGSPDWQFARGGQSFDNFPKPAKGMDKIDAEGVSPVDSDYAPWLQACVGKPNFPR